MAEEASSAPPGPSAAFFPPEFHDPEGVLRRVLARIPTQALGRFARSLCDASPADAPALSEEQLQATAAGVPGLCRLLLEHYGGVEALEAAGRALAGAGLPRASDGVRLAAVGFDPERCLDHALGSLEAAELSELKGRLRALPSFAALATPLARALLEAPGAEQLRVLLVGICGRFVALEVADQVLKAMRLKEQAGWLRRAVVRFGPRKCLDYVLENLGEEDLERFRLKLREACRQRGPGLVFGGEQERGGALERLLRLERVDAQELSCTLMSCYGEDEALEAAIQALRAVQQERQADWLRQYVEERVPWRHLMESLSGLGEESLEKFKQRLHDFMVQDGISQNPELWLKGAAARQLSKVMVGFYGRDGALEVACKVLKILNHQSLVDRLSPDSKNDWNRTLVDIFGYDLLQLETSVSEEKERSKETENSDGFGDGFVCNRCSSESFPEKIKPRVIWDSGRRHEIYKFCPVEPGSFRCCYTDLIFEVKGAVTVTYQFGSWKKHLSTMDAEDLMIAGPLFDIQAEPPEAVAAVYFPHILCLAGEDGSQVQVAHFFKEKMSLEKPDTVGPFHAEVKNPKFSQRGAIFRKSWFKQKIKVHAVALLYQALEITTPKFHLYLLPNDSSLKKSVHECELDCPSQRISKPPGILNPLKIGSHFFVQTLDTIKTCPKELKLQYLKADMEQQYFEIYAEHMQDELGLEVIEKNKNELVWEASVRRDELKFQASIEGASNSRRTSSTSSYASSGTNECPLPETHFIERHRIQLIQRTRNVEGILDNLLQDSIVDEEQYQRVSSKGTNQEKMRELYMLVPSWNPFCKDKLYEILKTKQKFLIDDLEME